MSGDAKALAETLRREGFEYVPRVAVLAQHSSLPEARLSEPAFYDEVGTELNRLWRREDEATDPQGGRKRA